MNYKKRKIYILFKLWYYFNSMNKIIKIYKKNFFLFWIIFIGFFLRIYYLIRKSGDLFVPNLGGDVCHHYNLAYNIANGFGPKTSFIFAYWFSHPELPAYTDTYGPGYSTFLSLFLHFGDNFFNLRLASLMCGIISILLVYYIGKKIHTKQLGLLSAFFIAINFFHIENSTVVMRELFTLVLVQIFFLILFYINKRKLLFFLIGLITGYISITTGIWPIFVVIFLIYLFLTFKKIPIKGVIFFLSGFFITSIHWILTTKKYFGEFYYSNLKFYPYVKSWTYMMYDQGFPITDNFWSNINLKEYLMNHFFWIIDNLQRASLILTPTFIYFLFFLLIPLCLYGAIKLKKNGFILILFSVIYFIGLSFATYALSGNLYPRHFLPLLSSSSLLLSSGIIPIINFYKNKYCNLNFNKFVYLIFLGSFIITLAGIEFKTSYWEADTKKFYEFGNKIKLNTKVDDVILFAVAPQDAWCATRRNVVHDIAFGGGKSRLRVRSEVDKYNVTHLFINLSGDNYNFSKKKLNKILSNYHNLDLKLVLENKENGYFFYKILKK